VYFLNNPDSGNIDINSMTSNLVNILPGTIFLLTLHGTPETVFSAARNIQFYQIKKAKLNPCLVRRIPSSLRIFFGQAESYLLSFAFLHKIRSTVFTVTGDILYLTQQKKWLL
jgi:hypothetical protein